MQKFLHRLFFLSLDCNKVKSLCIYIVQTLLYEERNKMDLKLKDISICDYTKKIVTQCTVDADIIVPDTKPDIYRILCVNAVADLDERYIRKDKIIFSGNVDFTIMYIGDTDKSKIYTIDYRAPFNHQAEVGGASEDALTISNCMVSGTDFKVKNSRKLSAVSRLNIDAKAMKYKDITALESVSGDDAVPFKETQIKSDSLIACKEVDFTLSDSISLPASGDEVEILDFNVHIDASEIKTVNNKAIIKGILPAKIFYNCDNQYSVYETEFSFTEIADLDMANSESILSSDFDIANISYNINEADGEIILETDIKVKGSISAYDRVELEAVSDIYSPDYSYDVKQSSINASSFNILNDTRLTVKDSISADNVNSPITKVHYMNIYPSCLKTYCDNSSFHLKGNVQTVIIYSNENGELDSIKKDIPFETDFPCEYDASGSVFDVSLSSVNYGYVLGSSHDVQARTILRLVVGALSQEKLSVINDFNEDKSSPIDKSSQASVTVCYCDGKSSLWDYAVKYNTTCEEIASVNKIDVNSELVSGSPILIPKRRV